MIFSYIKCIALKKIKTNRILAIIVPGTAAAAAPAGRTAPTRPRATPALPGPAAPPRSQPALIAGGNYAPAAPFGCPHRQAWLWGFQDPALPRPSARGSHQAWAGASVGRTDALGAVLAGVTPPEPAAPPAGSYHHQNDPTPPTSAAPEHRGRSFHSRRDVKM